MNPMSLLSILLITSGLKIKRAPITNERARETTLVIFRRGSEVKEKRRIRAKRTNNDKVNSENCKRGDCLGIARNDGCQEGAALPSRIFKVEGIREGGVSSLSTFPKPISSDSNSFSSISVYLVPFFNKKVHLRLPRPSASQ